MYMHWIHCATPPPLLTPAAAYYLSPARRAYLEPAAEPAVESIRKLLGSLSGSQFRSL